jgi:proteasome lid subunit RPN8/RPN11
MSAVHYDPPLLARIAALCEGDPGREVCGFVVRRRRALEIAPIANVADRGSGRDPAAAGRTSRNRYAMDPVAQLRLFKELASSGGEIAAVWHSHVESCASFSDEDRAEACAGGGQLIPGADYLVFGIQSGRVAEVRRYRFAGGEWIESALAWACFRSW